MRINTKGQVVIPSEIRKRFGIHPGDEVEFRSEKGRLVLVKSGIRTAVDKWAGKGFRFPRNVRSTDEFIEAARGR